MQRPRGETGVLGSCLGWSQRACAGSGLEPVGALDVLYAGANKVQFQRILQESGFPGFCLVLFQ